MGRREAYVSLILKRLLSSSLHLPSDCRGKMGKESFLHSILDFVVHSAWKRKVETCCGDVLLLLECCQAISLYHSSAQSLGTHVEQAWHVRGYDITEAVLAFILPVLDA